MKITITAVTEWRTDESERRGLASHEGGFAAHDCLLQERAEKEETDTWAAAHLPLTFEAAVDATDAEAVRTACLERLDEVCVFDLLKPMEAEWEVEA